MTMKRKFRNSEKVNGELAVRYMSEKAQKFYSEQDMLNVYEYHPIHEYERHTEDGKLYAYDGYITGYADGLTLEEVEKEFEEIYDDLEEQWKEEEGEDDD